MSYIAFDRKEAEARAAKLRKDRERAGREAEEREIWKELIEEKIQTERIQSAALIDRLRPAKRARKLLKQFKTEIDRLVDEEIALLRRGDVYPQVRKVSTEETMNVAAFATLITARCYGSHFKYSEAIRTLGLQMRDILSEDEGQQVIDAVDAADKRVRTVAREILREMQEPIREYAFKFFNHLRAENKEARLLKQTLEAR